ncbi:MAG: M14 family metallopeptidase [Candidatus Wallbacteria bacterium]|nr:M14 family metallopeptidase [Candidatus Wallbacteria bacterium]
MKILAIFLVLFSAFSTAAGKSVVTIPGGSRIAGILNPDHFDITKAGRGYLTAIVDSSGISWLEQKGIEYSVLYEDVEDVFSPWRSRIAAANRYHTYEEVQQELSDYASRYASITKLETIGKSCNGKDIFALKISDNPGQDESEPAMLLMGAHHAREWISVEVPMAFIDRLLKGYGSDSKITSLVNEREFWIVPIQNPDGLHYSQNTSDWRKNRRDNKDGSFGIDPNRNYGYGWGVGASASTWSDTYKGPQIFSEPENCAIRDFARREKFSVSISYHSHGNQILYPWSYTGSIQAPDFELLKDLAEGMAALNGFEAIQSSDLYPAGGESDDWLYTDIKCLAFTFELGNSFVPAESEVDGICAKNVASALYLAGRAGNLWSVLKHEPVGSTTDNHGPYRVKASLDLAHNPGFGVQDFMLYYKKAGGMSYSSVRFNKMSDSEFEAEIPGHDFGVALEYYILLNNSIRHPETGVHNFRIERYNRLVVDDDNGRNYERFLISGLDTLKLGYEVHDVKKSGSPAADRLKGYTQVIWLTGDDSSASLTDAEQAALTQYLDNGGSLLLTGQDIGYDIKDSVFYSKYLHSAYKDDNAGSSAVRGALGDQSLAFAITGGDGAGNQRYPDVIDASGDGQLFLTYETGRGTEFAASSYNGSKISEIPLTRDVSEAGKGAAVLFSGAYKVIYLGFGFEGIGSEADRRAFLNSCLDWLLPDTAQKAAHLCWIGEQHPGSEQLGRLNGAVEALIDSIADDCASDPSIAGKIMSGRSMTGMMLQERLREMKH